MNRVIRVIREQSEEDTSSTDASSINDFEKKVLAKAANESATDSMFSSIQAAIGGSSIDPKTGSMTVELECQIGRTKGDVIEQAIRAKVGDDKEAKDRKSNVDVMYEKTPIEVKSTEKPAFVKLMSDSQSLRKRTDKWYMYVKGTIAIGEKKDYEVWLMRSDNLFNAVKTFRGITDDEILTSPSIEEIEAMIDDSVRHNLAVAIWNKTNDLKEPAKAQKGKDKGKRPSMGLEKKIGLNRVRFDIKFEGLLRAYVKEILRS